MQAAAQPDTSRPFGMSAGRDDINDQLTPAQLPSHDFPWVAATLGLVLLLTVMASILWIRRRRRPQVVESLEHRARRRLAEAIPVDARAYHTELAAILIDYVEARLALRSTRLTSGEIVAEFRRNGVMAPEWIAMLEEFFAACDRAKFAPGVSEWAPEPIRASCRVLIDALAAQAAASPSLASPWKGWDHASV